MGTYKLEKFGIGDIVIGNYRNKYGVTARGIKHKVVATNYNNMSYMGEKDDIQVRVIGGLDDGYTGWVSSDKFDLVKKAEKPQQGKGKTFHYKPKQQYTVEYDKNLQSTFIRVGDVTIAVPVEEKFVSVTVKHPEDKESDEIAKAIAYYRLAKGVK